MTLETQEGITASNRNAHSCPDTWDPLIVFKRLNTRKMLVGIQVTQRLEGTMAHEGLYSSMSPSLNSTWATVRYIGPWYLKGPNG